MIKISVPNDDHVALRAMAKALEEIAVARGAPDVSGPFTTEIKIDMSDESVKERLQRATQDLIQAAPAMLKENNVDGSIEVHGKRKEVEVDTTSQQVKSLANTDSTGTPWDARIHSASKALNADGTWRLRRKPKDMDEEEWNAQVETVKVELQHGDEIFEALDKAERGEAVYYTSEEAEQKMEEFKESVRQRAEPTVTPEGDDFHTDTDVVTEQQVASFPPPPPVLGSTGATDLLPPAPTATALPVTMTFPQVMAFLTERHGRITSAQVDQIIADMGLEKITDLNTQPEHTGPFIARVKALLGE